MNSSRNSSSKRLVAVLNRDILRELRMADDCIRRAGSLPREQHPAIQRQFTQCAAAAMNNATALAAEVLALGGVPVDPGPQPAGASRAVQAFAAPYRLMLHYRRRLRMAERLGLLRLREVFQQIVNTKEWHLAHCGQLQRGAPGADRYLYG